MMIAYHTGTSKMEIKNEIISDIEKSETGGEAI
jgi:hypothetical protein